MIREAAYWIALSQLSKWKKLNINNLIVKIFVEYKITIDEFFSLSKKEWSTNYDLDENQIGDIIGIKNELPNYAFLAEQMENEGYEVIPLISEDYSATLKKNLKKSFSPPVLYVKGNKQILNEPSIAIVGSREASEIALKFTDNIVKLSCGGSKGLKVIVSGFAKGVDRQALDSAIKYTGHSIIVLPQGIMTFGTGFKKYYKKIIDGDVLVLSTFHPKSPWDVGLAMARNRIIYGLAEEIFVAESAEQGGTWSGVMDGIEKGRKIFVRKPENDENNANMKLIEKGAVPVDFNGNVLADGIIAVHEGTVSSLSKLDEKQTIESKIRDVIKNEKLSASQILSRTDLDWSTQKLTAFLKKCDFIKVIKVKKINHFQIKDNVESGQSLLFE